MSKKDKKPAAAAEKLGNKDYMKELKKFQEKSCHLQEWSNTSDCA